MLEERIQELVTELGQVETQLRTQQQSLQSSIDHLTRTTQQQASTIGSLTSQLNNFKSGIAAGSHPSFTGGAADFLCLPGQNPDLKSPAYSGHAVIYGAEYGKSTFLGADGNDVPCAVCRSRSGTSSVMIPARRSCNSGWKRQYYGYLMTGNPSQPGSANFICVDVNRETVLGGEHMYVDKMIYPVEAKCGALPCPPYADGYFVYCVVCTK
uniref:Uncharacterized protein n=1 Tax=Magallana gigas TaxID=29159 RepID=K1QQM6_MAGGI